MYTIKVIETSLDEDLKDFSAFLWQQSVSHQVVEESGRQVILVASDEDREKVQLAYQQLRSGELRLRRIESERPVAKEGVKALFLKSPVTLIFVILSIAGFLLVKFDSDFGWVKSLTFFDFGYSYGKAHFFLPKDEYWRLITPIFLHFNELHIVFNCLWLWDLGRRIEILQGSERMLGIVLLIGMGSNITQSMFAEVGIFGGMSGVIYGLLGYGWIWSQMRPEQSFHIPNAVTNFMMIWLVLCMMGVASLLGAGAVANAAHVGGLIMGLLMGFGAAVIAKLSD